MLLRCDLVPTPTPRMGCDRLASTLICEGANLSVVLLPTRYGPAYLAWFVLYTIDEVCAGTTFWWVCAGITTDLGSGNTVLDTARLWRTG